MLVRDEKILTRLRKVAAVAVLLTLGAVVSGCSHPAAAPSRVVPSAGAPAAPTDAATPAPGTPGASRMSPEDQAMNAQTQHKGQGAPP